MNFPFFREWPLSRATRLRRTVSTQASGQAGCSQAGQQVQRPVTKADSLGSRTRTWASAIGKEMPPSPWDAMLEGKVWSCWGPALPPCKENLAESETSEEKSRAVRWSDFWELWHLDPGRTESNYTPDHLFHASIRFPFWLKPL